MLSDPKLEDSQKKFYYLKILICLNPIIFGLLVIFTDFVDYRGLYESGKYISVAQNWLNNSSNFSERLPLYPLLIAFMFKIFGYNNLLALLIFFTGVIHSFIPWIFAFTPYKLAKKIVDGTEKQFSSDIEKRS